MTDKRQRASDALTVARALELRLAVLDDLLVRDVQRLSSEQLVNHLRAYGAEVGALEQRVGPLLGLPQAALTQEDVERFVTDPSFHLSPAHQSTLFRNGLLYRLFQSFAEARLLFAMPVAAAAASEEPLRVRPISNGKIKLIESQVAPTDCCVVFEFDEPQTWMRAIMMVEEPGVAIHKIMMPPLEKGDVLQMDFNIADRSQAALVDALMSPSNKAYFLRLDQPL